MSFAIFFRQLVALLWKNIFVFVQHPYLNLLKCLLIPVAYAVFLSRTPGMLAGEDKFGLGSPVSISPFSDQLGGPMSVYWADETLGNGSPSPIEIMNRVTREFSDQQLSTVHQVQSKSALVNACRPPFNAHSKCLAAVVFTAPLYQNTTVQYTLQVDAGVQKIDVRGHTGTRETRIFPLQYAIDQAVIELTTGKKINTPREWQFTSFTNSDSNDGNRVILVSSLSGISGILFLITFMGVVYQLAGSFATERAEQLTSHMKAMGLMDSARILSWITSVSLINLPAWITISLLWSSTIFAATSAHLLLLVHLTFGVSLASWSLFVAVPFGYRSPHLAAVAATFGGLARAINASVKSDDIHTTKDVLLYTIAYPPSFYVFALRVISGYERNGMPTEFSQPDPEFGLTLYPLVGAALMNIVLWPILAVVFERFLYSTRMPRRWPWSDDKVHDHAVPDGVAISIRNLNKTFKPSIWKKAVTAVEDLSIDIPSHGIFVLLGSNGAGKSTTLSILGGLAGRTGGSIKFAGGVNRPPRGTIGVVPQTNILFPGLSCLQTLSVWQAVKFSSSSNADEDLEQLLVACDLEKKIHADSTTLSGGQKRKLQLAIGIVANSSILLVDECTSGVDPLSRRALWKTLSALRRERTIIFTTHFLDEADLLADDIAILMNEGKLVAEGSPVALKTKHARFAVEVLFDLTGDERQQARPLHKRICAADSRWTITQPASHRAFYHLDATDVPSVGRVLQIIEAEKTAYGVVSYEFHGTTIEKIFLDLMEREKGTGEPSSSVQLHREDLSLDDGCPLSSFRQALIIFWKRVLVARKSWLTLCLTLAVGIIGANLSKHLLFDIEQCPLPTDPPRQSFEIPLYLPQNPGVVYASRGPLMSPPGVASLLGPSASHMRTVDVGGEDRFIDKVTERFTALEIGGISLDLETSDTLIAWNAYSNIGSALLNFANNLHYNAALNSTIGESQFIMSSLSFLATPIPGNFLSLFWAFSFGCAMVIFPAFFALYVANERRSAVQAMQLSNGLGLVGLWLGHTMFDGMVGAVIATSVYNLGVKHISQISGGGYLWAVMVIYGVSSALFSYCMAIVMKTPLAAFAVVVGINYVTALSSLVASFTTINGATFGFWGALDAVLSFVCPVGSMMRAIFVSGNIFFLLCDDKPMLAWSKFGGPILHLLLLALAFFAVLIWADSGSVLPRRTPKAAAAGGRSRRNDASALLKVDHITKTFADNNVLVDVSWETARDETFVLLGPNGAGKTTSLNIIRGDVVPDQGDVFVGGTSVVRHPQLVRSRLGVCPQFSAIDAQLTVRQHLHIYGLLKGLHPQGGQFARNIEAILDGVGLAGYADRLAVQLSGGNQRKLCLGIALLGNPAVLLIDEFSTGLDAKMKRDMWDTLRSVSAGKAIVITTHSLEEASALATQVGILAKKMLVMGTPASLQKGTYEVHFSCRTAEEVARSQNVMKDIPGVRLVEDVATRFEVPLDGEGMTLANLFQILTGAECGEYTIERATLESVFLKVIRENHVREDDLEMLKPTRSRTQRWSLSIFGM